jgi:DNA-binding MarR family transcriptional regulator
MNQPPKTILPLLAAIRRHSMTLPQFTVLECCADQEALKMGDLAELLGCSTANVTGIVDRCEKLGQVERVRGEDRRKIEVRITEKGRAELAQVRAAMEGAGS